MPLAAASSMVSPGSIGADGTEHVDGVESLLGAVVGSLDVEEDEHRAQRGDQRGSEQQDLRRFIVWHPFDASAARPARGAPGSACDWIGAASCPESRETATSALSL